VGFGMSWLIKEAVCIMNINTETKLDMWQNIRDPVCGKISDSLWEESSRTLNFDK
jgi:hypothetical protein